MEIPLFLLNLCKWLPVRWEATESWLLCSALEARLLVHAVARRPVTADGSTGVDRGVHISISTTTGSILSLVPVALQPSLFLLLNSFGIWCIVTDGTGVDFLRPFAFMISPVVVFLPLCFVVLIFSSRFKAFPFHLLLKFIYSGCLFMLRMLQ